MRPLSEQEKKLLQGFANNLKEPGERAQLLTDIEAAGVQETSSDGKRMTFEIRGYTRPKYRGQHPFAVEGRMWDANGKDLSVLLHADENGRLLELEFICWDDKAVPSPQWGTLRLFS